MANADTWVMQSCLFSLIAGRFCGEGWEQKILRGKAKFTDPDFVGALKFIETMYKDGVLAQSTLGTNYGDVLGKFANGEGAYYIDGDWRVAAFITDTWSGKALIPAEHQNDILLTVFPDIEGAKINNSTSGLIGTGFGMNAEIPAGSAKEEAAWSLLKWLVSKENAEFRVGTGAVATPSRIDADISGLNLEPLQAQMAHFASQFETITTVIDAVFHSDIYIPLNDGLQEIGMGAAAPKQVAADVQEAFDTWREANPW
jgi:raffinose/stachyose/melibiose transport system substrate-binding protein